MALTVDQRIASLENQLTQLKNMVGNTYPLSKVYKRDGSLYCIIDWDGEIRMFNITHQTFWTNTIKSSECSSPKKVNTCKREYLTYSEFKKLLSTSVPEEFTPIKEL